MQRQIAALRRARRIHAVPELHNHVNDFLRLLSLRLAGDCSCLRNERFVDLLMYRMHGVVVAIIATIDH